MPLPYKWSFRVREVHAITQWKEGCVYRTEKVGEVVADIDPAKAPLRRRHAMLVVKS